jgi:glucose-6-phosphate dehydrogenase assembly protein OpcA
MTDSPTDAFLSGQGIPVDPGRIEDELVKLWGPAAERAGGPDVENPNVTRVVLANLIVEADACSAGRIGGALDEVVARFPSRAIVLGRTEDGGRAVSAEVAALCHLPAPGLPQVCSERIVLKAGPGACGLLPGAVRPLLEANLPVVLWWTCDPRPVESLFRDLAREATRVVLDLVDPGADVEALRLGLDPAINAYARDSAWFAIAGWRELIAQFFDGPDGPASLARVRSVTIEATTAEPGTVPRLPVWLAAWLAGQLGWQVVRVDRPGPGRIEATFRAGDREVAVSIRAEVDPAGVSLRSATIELAEGDGPSSLRLARPEGWPDDVRVEICSDRACALPRVVHAPALDTPRRIAAALESSRHDPPFRRALPHALRLLGAGGAS